ncbi:MAG: putative bifunctional diguanylate cyclase/phosphodiesterase [Acidimicrobiales bacterium]
MAATLTPRLTTEGGATRTDPESREVPRRGLLARTLRRLYDQPGQFWTQLPALLLTIAYVGSTFLMHRPRSGYSGYWDGWVSNTAAILPLVPIALRVWRSSRLRAAWISMGIGVALFNAGQLIYLFHDQNLVPIPSPAPSDAAYLLSYAFFGVGIVMMTQRSYGTGILSIRLDGAVTGLAIAAASAMLWFDPILRVSGHPLQVVVGMSYPVFDLVLLVLLIAGLAPLRYRPNLPTVLLVAGVVAFVVGDVIYLNQQAAGTYVTGTPLDASWNIALWMIGLAAWPREDRRSAPRSQKTLVPQGVTLVPIVFGSVSVVVLLVSLVHHTSPVTSLLAIGALCLVIVRMGLTLREVRVMEKTNFHVARTDELTGLQNRRYFLEDGESRLASRDPSRRLVMLLIDLDGFKEINDSLGHASGDDLLKVVAARFRNRIEGRGIIARIGGDEFAATCEIDPRDDVVAVAQQLAASLDDPISLDGVIVRMGASIGVAVYPEHGTSQADLLRSADVAMYEAKRSHSGVCLYHPDHDLNSRERLSLTADLRAAIEAGVLELYYQPTRNLHTNQVQGVEALVRWPHPTLGLLLPEEFVPLAERVGLIQPLTHEVLRMAAAEAAALEQAGHHIQMNVNISHYDLIDSLLPGFIDRVLGDHGVAPGRLTLEVTESSLGDDLDRTRRSIEDLRSLGIKISIDDFGVGYSSMSQLLELTVDELKIDRSFVQALASDPRAYAVIASTIELARALHLTVVAEGVESDDDLQSVRRLGADVAQGFYLANPLTPAQLDEFLALEASSVARGAPESTGRSGVARPHWGLDAVPLRS